MTRSSSKAPHRSGIVLDNDDDSFNSHQPNLHISAYFGDLDKKKTSAREEALSSIIKVLIVNNVDKKFVQNNFVTLVYKCMHCIKKGSPKEINQAAHVIGLLSMIATSDKAHEAYEDVLTIISQGGLKSKLKNLEILGYLAAVTFFGASNSDETEQAMKLIWDFINPESSYSIERKDSPAVPTDAISAWSFLLSTLDGWWLSYKNWQGAISYFVNLSENNDEVVCEAACDALALIFESNCIEKFSIKAEDSHGLIDEGVTSIKTRSKDSHGLIDEGVTSIKTRSNKELKDNIIKQLKSQSTETGFSAVVAALNFLEDGKFPKTGVKIGGQTLTLSTWSQMIQLKFMTHFLGKDGFIKHMMENEKLHDVFDFTPKRRNPSASLLYVPEREEVSVSLYRPPVSRHQDNSLLPFVSREEKQLQKKKTMSPDSYLSKARTQLLKKKREVLSKERQIDCFDFADEC